ncbi:MAG: Rrf2 family transcriptional regulator [Coriobacteriales bacterium]|jgi:Rrf2 family protein|nr:Rrf2 family transcriptional regulator [Coriobacteriales bacterium]
MRITHRTDYAIHLLADLSESPDKPLGLRKLAEKHNVTYAFARTVQQGLLKAGIVTSARGINGGIMLAKPLNKISLLDVFEAAQNPLEHAFTRDDAPWHDRKGHKVSKDVWRSTKSTLGDHLSAIKMNQVLKPEPAKRAKTAKKK